MHAHIQAGALLSSLSNHSVQDDHELLQRLLQRFVISCCLASKTLIVSFMQGVRHEGSPVGTIETIGGVKVYIATPKVDYPKDKVLLFLPEAFGLELVNNQVCSSFAGVNASN
jgi:hypothetical protein